MLTEKRDGARPGGPKNEAEAGMGFLGQPAPPHQLGGLEERCKLPRRGPGAARPPNAFWCIFRLS